MRRTMQKLIISITIKIKIKKSKMLINLIARVLNNETKLFERSQDRLVQSAYVYNHLLKDSPPEDVRTIVEAWKDLSLLIEKGRGKRGGKSC